MIPRPSQLDALYRFAADETRNDEALVIAAAVIARRIGRDWHPETYAESVIAGDLADALIATPHLLDNEA